MGIYETLYAFKDSFGRFMGEEGTHPWSQGFPLTTPLEKFGGLELPEGMTSDELNKRLFKHGAAILCAFDCDMGRPHSKDPRYQSPYDRFFRFSFGPLLPESFESDIQLFREVYEAYKRDVGVE